MEVKDKITMGVEVHRCEECKYKQNSTDWISVDILPPNDEDVLVYFEYFRYGDGYNRLVKEVGIASTFEGEWTEFVNYTGGLRDLKIIAWKPLPEPPEY